MKTLTSRERILSIFKGEEVDRPALKLWGVYPDMELLHPDYKPVVELALRITDLFVNAWSDFNIIAGKNFDRYISVEIVNTPSPDWQERITTVKTPLGELRSIDQISTKGEPEYTREYLIKDGSDIEKLLSIPYEPYPVDLTLYHDKLAKVSDRGVVMFNLDHAGYAAARQCGSECLAILSCDEREMVDRLISTYAGRILEQVEQVIEKLGGKDVIFAWVGPELLIPPLLSPTDFEEFVYRYDKPICDAIHKAGGYVWVHCHGKVQSFIPRFIEMGVDVLNPLEPPKNGDIHLQTVAERYGDSIGLEGNIEIQDILLSDEDTLKSLIKDCIQSGRQSKRFILCPSAGFMEYPNPTKEYIRNLMTYLEYAAFLINK